MFTHSTQGRRFVAFLLFVFIIATSNFATAQLPLLQRKAALQQWFRQDFAVPNAPSGLAFDGNNIWVSNDGRASVIKIRAIDSRFS